MRAYAQKILSSKYHLLRLRYMYIVRPLRLLLLLLLLTNLRVRGTAMDKQLTGCAVQ